LVLSFGQFRAEDEALKAETPTREQIDPEACTTTNMNSAISCTCLSIGG
jgi:hypothetical protein